MTIELSPVKAINGWTMLTICLYNGCTLLLVTCITYSGVKMETHTYIEYII